jgi:superfamily II DNA/RNA helicase
MDYEERDEVFNKYRRGEIKIIVTCDYYKKQYALNKDFCVVNYDLPSAVQSSKYTLSGYYTLRIKSSGSLGNKGLVVNFITEETKVLLDEIVESFVSE